MPFDWRDFLSLAKELSNYPKTSSLQEAAARFAVSRAYYAAFCWATDYASKDLAFKGAAKQKTMLLYENSCSNPSKQKQLLCSTICAIGATSVTTTLTFPTWVPSCKTLSRMPKK